MADTQTQPRILVVEDEWLIANVLEAMLEDMGCEVLGPAPALEPAFELIAQALPDAALLDVSLTGAKSFPLAEELDRRGIPFLFLTGYVDNDLAPPFDRYMVLPKPVSEQRLRVAVAEMLGSRIASPGGPSVGAGPDG